MNTAVQAVAVSSEGEAKTMGNDIVESSVAIVQASEIPIGDDANEQPKQKKRKSRCLCIGLGCSLLVVIIVVVGLVLGMQPKSKKSDTTSEQTDSFGCRIEKREPDTRRLQLSKGFEWIGCFQRQSSVDTSNLDSQLDQANQAQACNDHCRTRHFGVVDSTCYCYAETPDSRLSIGSCGSVCNVALDQRMETYFKMAVDDTCNQETTTAVRNFLVEEDDTPFGFDIISNEFRSSPFELYKDECGTNIYEVQTEVSS